MRLLALDCETVPDTDAGRRLFGYTGTDAEVAAAMAAARLEATKGNSDFLVPGLHRIVAVGLAGIDTITATVRIEAHCEADEPALVELTHAALAKGPRLLTWNGNSFDLPVLRYRALRHGIPLPDLYGPENAKPWEQYQNRYGERHIDLADVLSGYGAAPRMRLDDVALLCGLAPKPMHGAEVFEAWLAGELERIRGYVESDAVTALRLALRWELSRGRLTPGELERLEKAIDTALEPVAA